MLAYHHRRPIYSKYMAIEQPEHVLGILASGGGSNFVAIHDAIEDGRLPNTMIAVVISDKEDAGALDKARERVIPALWTGDIKGAERDHFIADRFQRYGVEFGIGAGWLTMVGKELLDLYPVSFLNIHPAPLPRFGGKGMHGKLAHQAVLESGVKWSGPTVHLMNENYDEGQILGHTQVPVLGGDTVSTLAKRVLEAEHDLFWRIIAKQIERGPHPEAY
jgi:formyltetrahydrofolate-dependent phosphoribosylglycinamide formyltransferase